MPEHTTMTVETLNMQSEIDDWRAYRGVRTRRIFAFLVDYALVILLCIPVSILIFFLGRAVKAPQVKKVVESSKTKRAHVVQVRHRDEVEAPLTDWMKEAYRLQDQPPGQKRAVPRPQPKITSVKKKKKTKKPSTRSRR
jgi:hypothetical protein